MIDISARLGLYGFIITFIILLLWKPRMVMKVKKDHTESIDTVSLILISLLIGVVVSIITFLLLYKNVVVKKKSVEIIAQNY